MNLPIALIALIITVISTVAVRPLAIRVGLVDTPGGRKMHKGRVPLIGGICICLGVLIAFQLLPSSMLPHPSLPVAIAILLITGIFDDFHELSAKIKLAAQMIAALVICLWGQVIVHDLGNIIGSNYLQLKIVAIPFTIFAIIGLINAMNFIDGIDGLAGSTAFVQFMALFVACITTNYNQAAVLLSIVLASLLGFLSFNFPLGNYLKRRIFMGDTGSMLLGLLLAWFTITLSQSPHAVLRPITMVWIVALPLMELLTSIIRRISKGQSPLYPDKQHLHHLLLRKGFSALKITLIMNSFSALMATIGIILDRSQASGLLMLVLFLATLLLYIYLTQRSAQQLTARK